MSPTKVENGSVRAVVTPFYAGDAGVRSDRRGGEFACVCETPVGVPAGEASIDGKPITILSLRRSQFGGGMTVGRFAWAEQEAVK